MLLILIKYCTIDMYDTTYAFIGIRVEVKELINLEPFDCSALAEIL